MTDEIKAIESAYLSQVGTMFGVLVDGLVVGEPDCVVKFKLGLLSLIEAKKLAIEVLTNLDAKGT